MIHEAGLVLNEKKHEKDPKEAWTFLDFNAVETV